jgi:molecular chaperone HscB
MSDHFERLGLPRRFNLDAAAIEREYLARSREVHPDFFLSGGDLEQRASMEASAALNEAYAVLRDPFRRAEHLLQLRGGSSASEMKQMPVEFLEEMLELRMAIEEIKANPDSPEFLAMEKDLANRREKLLNEVGRSFDRAPPANDPQRYLMEIRQLLNATKYVQGLLRDLHAD